MIIVAHALISRAIEVHQQVTEPRHVPHRFGAFGGEDGRIPQDARDLPLPPFTGQVRQIHVTDGGPCIPRKRAKELEGDQSLQCGHALRQLFEPLHGISRQRQEFTGHGKPFYVLTSFGYSR
jgi:hypothetical protein